MDNTFIRILVVIIVVIILVILVIFFFNSNSNNKKQKKKYKYKNIIVGNGTAGGTLARYLSDKESTLVLEAGQNRSDDPNVLSGNAFGLLNTLYADKRYAVSTLIQDNVNFSLPIYFESFSAGRGWGGSSAHNSLYAVRGSPEYWNDVASFSGNPRFVYDTLLPVMKGFEAYHTFEGAAPVDTTQRGTSGPLQITQLTPFIPTDPLTEAISEVMNVPEVQDYNAGVETCVSPAQQTVTATDPPIRSFVVNALLTPNIVTFSGDGVNGRKLKIISQATVTKVLFDTKNNKKKNNNLNNDNNNDKDKHKNKQPKAIGVEYIKDGVSHRVYGKRIILSAGCPFSSQILQLSGIGDPNVLTPLGIQTLVNNPAVGANLKVHYGPTVTIGPNCKDELVSAYPAMTWFDGQPFYTANPGQRNVQIETFPGFIATSAEVPLIVNPPTFSPIGNFTAGITWIMNPRSSGSAYIIDNSPFTLPQIDFNLYSDGDLSDPNSDLSLSVASLKLTKGVADELRARMIYPTPENYRAGDEALAQAAISTLDEPLLSPYHYVGTTRFGDVVDSNFNVKGVENLLVVDNGVYNRPPNGNSVMSAYYSALVALETLGFAVPTV